MPAFTNFKEAIGNLKKTKIIRITIDKSIRLWFFNLYKLITKSKIYLKAKTQPRFKELWK
jgi:hypothetical protein